MSVEDLQVPADDTQRVTDPATKMLTRGTPFRCFLRLITAIVDEGKLRADADGLHVTAVDPANVAMVDVHWNPAGLQAWDNDGEHVMGVNFAALKKKAQFARMTGGEDGDPMAVRYDNATRKLELDVVRPDQGVQRVTSLYLIDPDSVRQEPDIPDLEDSLTNRGQPKTTKAFRDGVVELKKDSDHARVRADPDNPTAFQLASDGDEQTVAGDFFRFTDSWDVVVPDHYDTDDGNLTWTNDKGNILSQSRDEYADEERGKSSLFSIDYLKDIGKAIHDAKMDRVVLRWGEEFPVMIHFHNDDWGISGKFMLAPRIQSEGDDA